eukprot:1321402-Amorphochlora_amoeboformis.AAC.2
MPASRKVAMGTVLWLLGGYVSDFRASPRTHQGRNRSKKTFLSSKVEEIGPLVRFRVCWGSGFMCVPMHARMNMYE